MKPDLVDDLSAQEFCREVLWFTYHGFDFDTAWHMSKAERAAAFEAIAQVLLIRLNHQKEQSVMHLTVVDPFDNYVRGDVITDPDLVKRVLAERGHSVVQHYDHPEHFFKTDAELAEASKSAEAPAPSEDG